jgi:hypothetical protein
MISKKTLSERLSALPLDYQVIFLEDLEGTIDANLTVLEKASQKENGKLGLCKTQKTPIHLTTYAHKSGRENLDTFERTEPAKTQSQREKTQRENAPHTLAPLEN